MSNPSCSLNAFWAHTESQETPYGVVSRAASSSSTSWYRLSWSLQTSENACG